jgi:hypothetical protein
MWCGEYRWLRRKREHEACRNSVREEVSLRFYIGHQGKGASSRSNNKRRYEDATNLSSISDQNQTGPPSLSPVATDPLTIDKSLEVKGEVIGSESLYIDVKVMGTIYLPGSRVTVGRNGKCRLISVPVKWWFWERCMATSMPATL